MLTFSIQSFKCQVSAAAGVLCNVNVHCSKVFVYCNAKDVQLMGKICLVHLLVVKNLQFGCDLIFLVSVLGAACLQTATAKSHCQACCMLYESPADP